jgi:EAL domain-containing protein (putative c-di-GMP-specific phosphodiesterase class I)
VTIAFDNFKAGIVRLKELVETVTPDYVKLDMALVRSTDIAVARKRLVQEVIQLSADLGIMVVAKGIETEEQADTFRELGCHLAQGYLFGRPQPVSAILTPAMA